LTGLGGCSPAEWRLCVYGSHAWQTLGAQACGVNIVQGCAGLGGVAQQSRDHAGLCRPGRDCKCLLIPSLKGSSHRDPTAYGAIAPWAYGAGLGMQHLLFF
jgi:hypothetical protein